MDRTSLSHPSLRRLPHIILVRARIQSGTTRRRRRRTGHLTLTLKEMTIIGNTDCGRRVVALHTLAAILQRKIKRRRTLRCRYCRSSAACIPCQSRSSSGTQRAARHRSTLPAPRARHERLTAGFAFHKTFCSNSSSSWTSSSRGH